MRNSKLLLAVLATAASVGFAAPAAAFSDPVSPVTITDFSIVGEPVHLTGTPGGQAVDYPNVTIGAFSLNLLFPDTSTITGQLAFCDDLLDNLDISQPYFFTSPTDPTGTNDYLSPIGQTAIDNITGLMFAANLDPNVGSDAQISAAYQLAIWEIEYGGPPTVALIVPPSDSALQGMADTLIGQAHADFQNFQADGTFSLVQLESPCDPNAAGKITLFTAPYVGGNGPVPDCQSQGLITLVPIRHTEKVPEPGTLALLGSGLIGLGAYRRRRRKTA